MSDEFVGNTLVPGMMLKQARETEKLSTSDVAGNLNISTGYVEALESGSYDVIPSETFVVGYLRAYARLVNLDPVEVVDAYRAMSPATVVSEGADRSIANDKAAFSFPFPRHLLLPVLGLSLVIVIGLLLVLLWPSTSNDGEEVPVSAPMTDEPSVSTALPQRQAVAPEVAEDSAAEWVDEQTTDQQTTDQQEATVDADQLSDSSVSKVVDDAEERSVDEKPDNTGAMVEVRAGDDAGIEPSAAAMDQLQFSFLAECWLEVIDAQGDVLVTDLYQSGDTVETQGLAPFKVVIGDVDAVAVTLNGEQLVLRRQGNRSLLRTSLGSAR